MDVIPYKTTIPTCFFSLVSKFGQNTNIAVSAMYWKLDRVAHLANAVSKQSFVAITISVVAQYCEFGDAWRAPSDLVHDASTVDAHSADRFEPRSNSHLGGLLTIINSTPTVDGGIMSTQRSAQLRYRLKSSDFAKVTLSFEHAGRCPAQDHHSSLPALYPSCDLAHSAEQILDQIGR